MDAPLIKTFLAAAMSLVLTGCGLEQDIELELPAYESQPAVEAYLTPGQPFRVLVTRTAGFFDPLEIDSLQFLENLVYQDLEITITWANNRVELDNIVAFDADYLLLYNYSSRLVVPHNYTDSFYFEMVLPDGRSARAATKLLPVVPIDSNVVEYPEPLERDTLARVFTYITDPEPDRVNRFRRLLTYAPVDSSELQDFVFTDEQSDQASIPVGTIYYFDPGDTIYVYNAHVDEAFEKYLLSVQLAEQSNGNPFAQPSSLLTNLRGDANATGIFTSYAYDVDTLIIPAPQ